MDEEHSDEYMDDTIIIKTNPTTKKYSAVEIKGAIFRPD
jgi:hypothetical protein